MSEHANITINDWNALVCGQQASRTPWTVLLLQGPDAHTFLQGQTTTDTRSLQPDHSLLASTLSLKGRVLELFFLVYLDPQSCFLLMPKDQADQFQQRMQRYLAFSKSTLTKPPAWSVRLEGHEPQAAPLWHTRTEAEQRIILISPTRSLIIEPCPEDPNWLNESCCLLSLIQAGIPYMPASLADHYLPQMFHLQALDGLSFNKGCYTGQEIVARAWFRGQIKQSMQRWQGISPVPVSSGSPLYTSASSTGINSGNDDREKAGEVLCAVQNTEHIWEGLAMLRQDTEPTLWGEDDIGPLVTQPIGYAIPVR